MDSPSTIKRSQLHTFIQQELQTEVAIRGIVVVGSVAAGTAGIGSDIDAVVFLEPLDLYAVPAEFQWCQSDGSYHGIFVDIPDAIQFDFKRVSLCEWAREEFEWPEPTKLELSLGWIAFDVDGAVAKLIERKTTFSEALRRSRLDHALVQLDQLLTNDKVEDTWERHGAAAAHDRLNEAFEQLTGAVFAYNKRWRSWRSREQSYLQQLNWLPELLKTNALGLVIPTSGDKNGYVERANLLRTCFFELIQQCQSEGLYRDDPISEAFVRCFDEPGRDWNIATWVQRHNARSQ